MKAAGKNGGRMGRMGRTGTARQNSDVAEVAGHSPGPWRLEESMRGWKLIVVDANGLEVAQCFGEGSEWVVDQANANLIVRAVNAWFRNGDGRKA